MLRVVDRIMDRKRQLMYAAGGVLLLVGSVVGAVSYLRRGVGSLGGRAAEPQSPSPAVPEGVATESRADVAAMLEHLNTTIIQKAEDFFYPAKGMVETTARMLSKYSAIRKDPFFERYVRDVVKAYPQFDSFYVADATGGRVIAFQRGNNQVETDVIDRTPPEPYRVLKRWDAAGEATSVERHTEKQLLANPLLGGLNEEKTGIYDARKRPWYRKAVKERATCWSDVYVFSSSREPGVTVASPTLGSTDDPLFVVAADFEIKNMSQFLAELAVGGEGLAFIINASEELVAYPQAQKVLTIRDNRPVLAKADEVVPECARAALAAYREKTQEMFVYTCRGKRYIASFAPFLEHFGNDWRIVVVMREDDLPYVGVGARG